jgi:hypothetical protein
MITALLIMLTSMAGTLNQLELVPRHVFTGRLFPILLSIFKRAKREFLPQIYRHAPGCNEPPDSQRNMDYSIFKALDFNMEGIEAALISYDVMCQWSVHMMERVTRSDYLKKPDSLELRLAIGLFHIHGHQDACLARYSPSFVKGGRQIDGETIETLWAPLNEISRSTRGMSTSHRREVIDDHMNDSNWKKLVDIGKFPQIILNQYSCRPNSQCRIYTLPEGAFRGSPKRGSIRVNQFVRNSGEYWDLVCRRGVRTKRAFTGRHCHGHLRY